MLNLVQGMPQWVGWVYGAITAVAAFTDYRSGKIYNWLTIPALVLGLVLAGAFGWVALGAALQGLGLASLLFIPLFFLRILGGGDVKLMLAMGTVLGFQGTLELTLACFTVAGAGSLGLLFVHRRVILFFKELFKFLRSIFVPGLELQWPALNREVKAPFGIAIFIGFLYVFAKGSLP